MGILSVLLTLATGVGNGAGVKVIVGRGVKVGGRFGSVVAVGGTAVNVDVAVGVIVGVGVSVGVQVGRNVGVANGKATVAAWVGSWAEGGDGETAVQPSIVRNTK